MTTAEPQLPVSVLQREIRARSDRGDQPNPAAAASPALPAGQLPPDTRLIFLVGAPRSGTTWLQLLLSASPHIATAVETNLFSHYMRSLVSEWKSHRDRHWPVGLHHLLKEDEYLALVRELASKVMARILATKPGATIVLEKSPIHAFHWRDILTIFPDARFIHIVRDPRAVVASMLAASQGWGAAWAPRRVADACANWRAYVNSARQIALATDRYFELLYKDLHLDGVAMLRSVFAWCGVDVSDAEAADILEQHRIDRLRSRQAHGAAFPFDSRLKDFFRKGEIDGWRTDLTRREVRLVEHLTADLMAELGFAPVESGRRCGWNSAAILPTLAAEWVRGGLSWRLQKYADTLRRGA